MSYSTTCPLVCAARPSSLGIYPYVVKPVLNGASLQAKFVVDLGYSAATNTNVTVIAYLVPGSAAGDTIQISTPQGTGSLQGCCLPPPTSVQVGTPYATAAGPIGASMPVQFRVYGTSSYLVAGPNPSPLPVSTTTRLTWAADPVTFPPPVMTPGTVGAFQLQRTSTGAAPTTGSPLAVFDNASSTRDDLRAIANPSAVGLYDLAWVPAGSSDGYPVVLTLIVA